MPISRKISVCESNNLGDISKIVTPIKSVFNVGLIADSNSIVPVGNFETAENSSLTKKLISTITNNSGTLPVIEQTYEFSNSNTSLSLSDWQSYINSNLVTNLASDHYTNIDGLFDINDALNVGFTQPTYTANVNYEYNFLIELYENTISNSSVSEKILPCMYSIMYAKLNNEVGSQNKTFDNINTLNNTINATETYYLQNNNFSSNKPSGEYHDVYSKALLDIINRRKVVNLNNVLGPMTNVVVPVEQLKQISSLNEYKELYPMYNEINITMDKFSSFSTLLKDSNLSLSLINYVINNTTSVSASFAISEQRVVYKSDVETDNEFNKINYLLQNSEVTTIEPSYQNSQISVYDIFDWWNKTKEDFTPSETNNTNTLVLGVDDESMKVTEKNYTFARSLSYLVFYGKLRKLIQQTQRNFSEVISGSPAYSENIFYKIQKFKNGSTTPIQTFWIPNSADIDTFTFIDTQVKYNTNYRYSISAFCLIIGNSINTTINNVNYSGMEYTTTLNCITSPLVSLVEVPIYTIENKIIDDPPLTPEVLIIPTKNVNNKIKFYFNNSTGEIEDQFISLKDSETQTLKNINTMFSTLPRFKTKFKSDDIASSFEIYRLTTKPTEYVDFIDNLLATVSTDYDKKTIVKASSASYIDTIKPNTKYYYIFRSIDIHGHISNPTDVYELEMVDDDGAIYLRTNILNIKTFRPNKNGNKTLKKLFYIKPEILQTLINTELLQKYNFTSSYDIYGIGNGNILSISTSPVWDKKFKLRFVSKKTGKMFDLNLQLNIEIDKENL